MATLVSPGVDIQLINQSMYSSAGPGTVPLILVATAENKTSIDGGTAAYTSPEKAGELYFATSQRDLLSVYGTPTFKKVAGTVVQGHELSEYGLHAAYSFLSISNRAYILRANIDTAQLEPSVTAPVGNPVAGTYWFDLSETAFGVFESNGNPSSGLAWESRTVLAAADGLVVPSGNTDVPAPNTGNDGDFAVVVTMSDNLLYEKLSGTWYQVGSSLWKAQKPTKITGRSSPNALATGDEFKINEVTISFVAGGVLDDVVQAINDAVTSNAALTNIVASKVNNALVITDTTGADISIYNVTGTPLATLGITAGVKAGVALYQTASNNASYPANSAAGSVWIKGREANRGANWKVKYWSNTVGWVTVAAPFYPFDSTQNDGVAIKDQAATSAFGTPATGTIYVGFDATNGTQQLRRWSGTRWENLSYEAGTVPPTTAPAEGTFWYNADFKADIMYGDGSQWLGYRVKFPATDPNGVIISGTEPTAQSGGDPLVDNDLWINSADLENYPALYRYDSTTRRWGLIDKTDQTTPFGIVFADARQSTGTNYNGNPNNGNYDYNSTEKSELLLSNFVDPDAPDARTHPDGVLLFNTRVSTYNVKEWKPNYFKMGGYDSNTDFTNEDYTNSGSAGVFPATSAGRWVTASGLNVDGVPYMGRKAQRIMIVRALAQVVASNEEIRSEMNNFNLIAAPGYPELIDEMIALNASNKQVSFIVGDTPIRMKPTGTAITNWATNAANVPSNGEEGLTAADEYVGVYYPWGLSTDTDGNEVMVPPSSIAMNTIAYNDQVAYPWYAPAGERRGLVTNATSVGYLTDEGEYRPVILNPGQRNVLYTNRINPIGYIPGRGLVVYGQKTLTGTASAMDRINVVRLINYVRYNLDLIVKPYLFEPNDELTRDSAQSVVENFFNGLVGLRALEDYVVLCDETNNTPERRDRNELWIDVAIQPLHAIEFIYIPVRVLNSGQDISTAIPTTF